MLFTLLLFVHQACGTQIKQNKRYSIRNDANSSIPILIDDVYYVEIPKESYDKNLTQQGFLYANFCSVKNPTLYLDFKAQEQICENDCLIIVDGQTSQKFVLREDGYLQISQMKDDLSTSQYSEILITFTNYSNLNMSMNKIDHHKFIIWEEKNVTLLQIEGLAKTSFQLNESIGDIRDIEYIENYIYVTTFNNCLYIINEQGENEQEIYLEGMNEYKIIKKLKDNYEYQIIGYNNEEIVRINQLDQPIKIKNIKSLFISDQCIYVLQQNQNQQFLLEYDLDFNLIGNKSIISTIKSIYLTNKYIFILQENIVQIGFTNIKHQQIYSKNILEAADRILDSTNDSLLVFQQGNIISYKIKEEKAQIICEPIQQQPTGKYYLKLNIGYFNTSKIEDQQLYELYVYKEIFQQRNQGLYVGLILGLSLTVLTIIIFIRYWLRLKDQYKIIIQQQQEDSFATQDITYHQ